MQKDPHWYELQLHTMLGTLNNKGVGSIHIYPIPRYMLFLKNVHLMV